MLEQITRSPYLNLLFRSGYERPRTIYSRSLGAHPGALIFSLIQILKTLPEIMDGAEKLVEAKVTA